MTRGGAPRNVAAAPRLRSAFRSTRSTSLDRARPAHPALAPAVARPKSAPDPDRERPKPRAHDIPSRARQQRMRARAPLPRESTRQLPEASRASRAAKFVELAKLAKLAAGTRRFRTASHPRHFEDPCLALYRLPPKTVGTQ